MATQKLNLTRDQLASFLQNFEQVKQFERLFAIAAEVAPDNLQATTILAGNADAKAIQALGMIAALAQELAVSDSVSDVKATQALGQIAALAQEVAVCCSISDIKGTQALDQIAMLAQETAVSIASAENKANQALAMFSNLPASVRSNQVLTWLSM